MDTAFLVVTNRCSRNCPFCFYSTGYQDYPADELDGRAVLAALEKIVGMGVKELIITGGEPLLRPDITGIVKAAGNLGLARLFLTNGELLDPSVAESLLSNGIEGITLSVASLDEAERLNDVADLLSQSPGTLVTVTIVFSRANASELKKLFRWARERGFGSILQPAFIPRASRVYTQLSPHFLPAWQWEDIASVLRDWGKSRGSRKYVDYVLGIYGGGAAHPERCLMGTEAFVVDCDGSVFPCFHRRDMPAGNILDMKAVDLGEILAGFSSELIAAPCYGEHCVSLFSGD